MRLGVTPVLIPNTTVKTQTADGTMRATAWKSRWLPDIKKQSALYPRLEIKIHCDFGFWWLIKRQVTDEVSRVGAMLRPLFHTIMVVP